MGSEETPPGATEGGAATTPEERAEAERLLERVRREIAGTPAAEIVGNHAVGLWQLALIHLGLEQPNLEDARLAIDALGGLLDGTGDRLGERGGALRDALTELRVALARARG